jgi:hypothetical protein
MQALGRRSVAMPRERPAARRDHADVPSVIKTAGHGYPAGSRSGEPGTLVEEVTEGAEFAEALRDPSGPAAELLEDAPATFVSVDVCKIVGHT